jgi:hypothetical protein
VKWCCAIPLYIERNSIELEREKMIIIIRKWVNIISRNVGQTTRDEMTHLATQWPAVTT